MTDAPEDEAKAATVQPVAELFTGDASALWATSYTIDLALFNEFLLGRLGDPPLNIAVLADQRRLAAGLARIPAERTDTLAAVNRRWLLRGIRTGGAFHPKSYLKVAGNRATLLVGSGNLSVGGLDEGREVFTTFRSGTPVGGAAITAWQSWMRRLVGLVGDTTLAERFQDLEARIPRPSAVAPAVKSPLLHNLDTPIADQLAAAVAEARASVEELWLSAPFYDADAAAVGALLDVLTPARVRVFVTRSTSVNGDRLAERLAASGAQVTVTGYEPDRFVHAKLIGDHRRTPRVAAIRLCEPLPRRAHADPFRSRQRRARRSGSYGRQRTASCLRAPRHDGHGTQPRQPDIPRFHVRSGAGNPGGAASHRHSARRRPHRDSHRPDPG